MIAGASKALSVHADAAIRDGTLVHLNPGAPSLFKMVEADVDSVNAIQTAAKEPIAKGDNDFDIFEATA
jgi:hypothetical protein